jgi:pimeloyl-ACP methyl ester carboxylesterase
MGKAMCRGASINYRCTGEGRDVVLIHGLATNLAFWHLPVLLPLARNYRVTIFDLRGHGKSSMPPTGYTLAHMADDLNGLLDHLQIERLDLIGHSFGGAVALHYALMHPERVNSLTIADSRIRAFQPTQSPKNWFDGELAKQKLEKLGLTVPEGEKEAGFWLLEQLASPQWQQRRTELQGTPLFIPFGGWNGGQRTAQRWLKLVQTTTAKQDITSPAGLTAERLATIQASTLAIYGEKSPVIMSFYSLLEHLPKCKPVIVPGAGHFFPLTQAKIFFEAISQFLEEVGRRDQRKYSRIHLKLPVHIRIDDFAGPATTVNISQRGLLIESSWELEVGSKIELMTTPADFGQRIVAPGRVVRTGREAEGCFYQLGIELDTGDNWAAWLGRNGANIINTPSGPTSLSDFH